jgi:hypothetical protein
LESVDVVVTRAGYDKVPEAARYATRIVRHRVPYLVRLAVTAAHGHDRLESVTVLEPDGSP